ncbi:MULTISPECIES: hypothetical protein [Bradyrhizobium]|nr:MULTISPECIES: hypothetical protein [Bradyrhizobium]KYK44016.1 hypothetical protein A1D31_15010 [Bradyrhizobium liaoningense]UPJ69037.1 hypothetical protein IVB23_18265 [Bradyrhizobium sp. 191]
MGSVDGISGNSTHDLEATVDTDGEPHDANIEFEQLKLLFDYTKFHIGLYTTIATIFGALFAASDKAPIRFSPVLLLCSAVLVCIAGGAGGIIASSIPGFSSYKKFWDSSIGPAWCRKMKAEYWTYVEHAAFWAAVILALASIVFPHVFDGLPHGRGYS